MSNLHLSISDGAIAAVANRVEKLNDPRLGGSVGALIVFDGTYEQFREFSGVRERRDFKDLRSKPEVEAATRSGSVASFDGLPALHHDHWYGVVSEARCAPAAPFKDPHWRSSVVLRNPDEFPRLAVAFEHFRKVVRAAEDADMRDDILHAIAVAAWEEVRRHA